MEDFRGVWGANPVYQAAQAAHSAQVRKSDGSPYFTHPERVAATIADLGFSREVVAAALLHDVLEDTPMSAEEVEAVAGPAVLALVQAVSEPAKSGSWEDRKASYKRQVVAAGEGAMAVALADKLDNMTDSSRQLESVGREAFWASFKRGEAAQRVNYMGLLQAADGAGVRVNPELRELYVAAWRRLFPA